LDPKPFWESEFNIVLDEGYTAADERLSNRKLTVEQVRKHYEDYYYPSNFTLYVAGKFDRAKIMKLIERKWAAMPARTGKSFEESRIAVRDGAYKRLEVSNYTPYVSTGTKIVDARIGDEEIVDSYVEYVAHRLMKEIRNVKGQTYTASGVTSIFRRHGYAILNFQTQEEHFKENVALARRYLENEAEKGSLTEAQVKEAVDLYQAQYGLMGKEAEDMMKLAYTRTRMEDQYGKFLSPYEHLKTVSADDYNATLRRHFKKSQAYEYLKSPPLFFRYDSALLMAIVAILSFMLSRRLLTRNFKNDGVRWIRKVKYPPLMIVEYGLAILGFILFIHVESVLNRFYLSLQSIGEPNLFVTYLGYAVSVAFFIACYILLFCGIAKKLMVVDDNLIIKNISYRSKSIPLSQIAAVRAVRMNPFNLGFWWKLKHRAHYFNPKFWQKGMLIELKNGKAYFFSVSSATKAKEELERLAGLPNVRPGVDFHKVS
jgi:hypothetical protein